MKRVFLICLAVFGFVFAANAQVCKTEGQKCVTKDGDRGICREVTVTQTTSSTIGSSNSGTSGYSINGGVNAGTNIGNAKVGATVGGGYNSSNTRSNSNQKSVTETESWKEMKCKKQDDGASQATPAW